MPDEPVATSPMAAPEKPSSAFNIHRVERGRIRCSHEIRRRWEIPAAAHRVAHRRPVDAKRSARPPSSGRPREHHVVKVLLPAVNR
jgi:hypothetical protein